MVKPVELTGLLKPRVGVVVTTWTHEDGADYARHLVDLFPTTAPLKNIDLVVSPVLLEFEKDIPDIARFFSDKNIDALILIPGNFTLDQVMPLLAQQIGLPTVLWGMTSREAWGAFVGLQQTLYPFKELGLEYIFVVGDLGDARIWQQGAELYARGGIEETAERSSHRTDGLAGGRHVRCHLRRAFPARDIWGAGRQCWTDTLYARSRIDPHRGRSPRRGKRSVRVSIPPPSSRRWSITGCVPIWR